MKWQSVRAGTRVCRTLISEHCTGREIVTQNIHTLNVSPLVLYCTVLGKYSCINELFVSGGLFNSLPTIYALSYGQKTKFHIHTKREVKL
jgi:hypothetical protein